MYSKISVLIPTRQRLDRLRTLLDSYDRTAGPDDSELVFRVDDDDVDSQTFLEGTEHVVVAGPRYAGYKSMPTFFNELYEASHGDVLMCGNDDMVFQSDGWAEVLLEEANLFPDGLFDLGVGTLNQDHFPFSCISRRAAERMGFLWDPRIFWGDIFLRDVMAAFDRCVLLPDVQIDHDWAGFKPDKVFMESDKDIMRWDPNYWAGTHARAVAAAVEKLRGLLA